MVLHDSSSQMGGDPGVEEAVKEKEKATVEEVVEEEEATVEEVTKVTPEEVVKVDLLKQEGNQSEVEATEQQTVE